MPEYDHVVVVVFENHSYDEIANSAGATYINDVLRPQSANFTQSYGLQHPSQPNYYWLFSGSNQGITTDSAPTAPYLSASNLYTGLVGAGKTFGAYADYYPGETDQYVNSDNYAVRHLPWLGFTNVPSNITQDFSLFPQTSGGFAALPTVSFVIPGLDHDMHDYDSLGHEVSDSTNSEIAIANGDSWLAANISAYVNWAKDNNSLLILTFDEDSSADWPWPPENGSGLTSPDLGPNASGDSGPNQITTLFAGADIVAGDYEEGEGITHVNVLRTIEGFYGLSPNGEQSSLALAAGIGDGAITDVFAVPEPGPLALEAMGMGLLGILLLRRRERKRRA